jgi:hypothetical protein
MRWTEAAAAAKELMRECEPGTLGWLTSAATILTVAQNGDVSGIPDVVAGFSSMSIQPGATADWGMIASLLLPMFAELGLRDMSRLVKHRLDATPVDPQVDLAFLGYKCMTDAAFYDLLDDPAEQLASARSALRLFEEAGNEPGSLAVRSFTLPSALNNAGQYPAARQIAEAAAVACRDRGQRYLSDLAVFGAENAASLSGDPGAAEKLRARASDASNLNVRAWVTASLLSAELDRSPIDREALAAAEGQARQILDGGLVYPRGGAWLRTFLAFAALAGGRWSEALSLVDAAFPDPDALGGPRTEAFVVRTEALHGLGRFDEAREIVAAARRRLLKQADGFADASERATYLARKHVARTLSLAAEWLDAGSTRPG